MNRDARHIDVYPGEDGDMLFTSPVNGPQIKVAENWCFECATLVSVHPGWFPLQTLCEMAMHNEKADHSRWQVRKSRESGRWLVLRGDDIVTTYEGNTTGWKAAMLVAFERHPWTIHKRAEKRSW